MGTRTQYTPGTFSWADLTTPDQAAAKEFYSGLFGWSFTDMPVEEGVAYSMASLDGATVAALAPQPEQQRQAGVPPMWNSYVTVQSADETAERARELGAQVHAGPFDVFTSGRMAVIQDPQGAFFEIWQPKDHIGAGLVNAPGALCWNELTTPDVDGSSSFYGGLFGWSTSKLDMSGTEYWVISNDGRGNGGMMAPMADEQPTGWLVYFGCDDIDAALARVSEHGGGQIVGPTEITGGAKIAVARDPQGGVFALYTGNFED